MDTSLLIWWIVWSIIIGALWYWVGRKHQQAICDAEADRMERIDPPSRTAGLPTNLDAPASDARVPRWRNGQFKSGPPQPR